MDGTILVVEDNLVTRTLLQHTLELEGFDVMPVADGKTALAWMEGSVPRLVVLDVMMPGIDGLSVLKHMRDGDGTRDVPVVMLSALDDPDTMWKGWTAGCDRYLTKPFDPEDVIRLVHELIEGEAA